MRSSPRLVERNLSSCSYLATFEQQDLINKQKTLPHEEEILEGVLKTSESKDARPRFMLL